MASQDWFDKDFYKVLGVSKDISDADLKKAYRKLARKYHPDSNQGDAAAEAKFKEISEAYSVLSDKDQREEYTLGHIEKFFPQIRAEKVVFFHHCWREDPWAKGAWTDYLPGQWWMFAVAGLVAILIAFLTVSFQSVKAALANPVKSLRSE